MLSKSGRRRCSYLALSPEGFTRLRGFPFIPSFLRFFFFFFNHEWKKRKKSKNHEWILNFSKSFSASIDFLV